MACRRQPWTPELEGKGQSRRRRVYGGSVPPFLCGARTGHHQLRRIVKCCRK